METAEIILKPRKRRVWLPLALFFWTLLTTTAPGGLLNGVDIFAEPWNFASGLPFAVTVMTILLFHEMGHYLTARYHGVEATLPILSWRRFRSTNHKTINSFPRPYRPPRFSGKQISREVRYE